MIEYILGFLTPIVGFLVIVLVYKFLVKGWEYKI